MADDGEVHITAAVPYSQQVVQPAVQPAVNVPDNQRLLNVQVMQPMNVADGGAGGVISAQQQFPVEDLTVWHWLACLCCNCCGCGLIAFILDQFVKSAYDSGNFKLAHFTQQRARRWMMAGAVTGGVVLVIFIVITISGGNPY